MKVLFKLMLWISCWNFPADIYAQKIITNKPVYSPILPFEFKGPGTETGYQSPRGAVVKFTIDETLNLSLNNNDTRKCLRNASLYFSGQNLVNSKFIAAPINPASPLLHDESHVLALGFHSGHSFPLLLKFALYF